MNDEIKKQANGVNITVSYTHLRAHETRGNLVCRLLLEKKKSANAFYLFILISVRKIVTAYREYLRVKLVKVLRITIITI